MIRPYRGKLPQVAASAYVDPSAQVIGDVVIGDRSSIWPGVVARGDVHHIHIGTETNIQDNSVLHADAPAQLVPVDDHRTAVCEGGRNRGLAGADATGQPDAQHQ